jgi:hypothetical protein
MIYEIVLTHKKQDCMIVVFDQDGNIEEVFTHLPRVDEWFRINFNEGTRACRVLLEDIQPVVEQALVDIKVHGKEWTEHHDYDIRDLDGAS